MVFEIGHSIYPYLPSSGVHETSSPEPHSVSSDPIFYPSKVSCLWVVPEQFLQPFLRKHPTPTYRYDIGNLPMILAFRISPTLHDLLTSSARSGDTPE